MGNERDLTPQEAMKEARKILPDGAWVNIVYYWWGRKSGWVIETRDDDFTGRTLRSCLSKLRKEIGDG